MYPLPAQRLTTTLIEKMEADAKKRKLSYGKESIVHKTSFKVEKKTVIRDLAKLILYVKEEPILTKENYHRIFSVIEAPHRDFPGDSVYKVNTSTNQIFNCCFFDSPDEISKKLKILSHLLQEKGFQTRDPEVNKDIVKTLGGYRVRLRKTGTAFTSASFICYEILMNGSYKKREDFLVETMNVLYRLADGMACLPSNVMSLLPLSHPL